MIQVHNLIFRYQDSEQPVINGLDLTIEPGEWLVIFGTSGCGKSTLALALAGFLGKVIPGEMDGEIVINGKDIHDLEMSEIAGNVYLVQQNPENQFCTLTVKEELAFGLENRCMEVEEIKSRIQSALAALNAEDLLERRLDELSGGQQQKIAIATALAIRPEVLILDEPTSNLDPEALRELLLSLQKLRSDNSMGVIIIEHRKKLMNTLASRYLEMRDGRLFEPEEVISCVNHKKTPQGGKLGRTEESEPIIELENHVIRIEDRIIVDIDHLALHPGELISLMGPNGSGKSSLLLSILGLIPSESKRRWILNQAVEGKLPRSLMRQFGLAFQNPDHQIFCDSVKEEIFYAPDNYELGASNEIWIDDLLAAFNFQEIETKHPYLLSYGQKGRLNLASILAYKPRILLLDEVFIGQDYGNVIFLLETIRNYIDQNGAAAIIVNHMANPVLEYSDRLIFLEMGQIALDCSAENANRELKYLGKEIYLPELYG